MTGRARVNRVTDLTARPQLSAHGERIAEMGRHRFQFVQKLHGREWAECSCGWASPDIIGRETAIAMHERHVKEAAR